MKNKFQPNFSLSQWIALQGTMMAMILSYLTHKSILWAFVSGFFGWLYVIYWYFYYSS